MKLETRAAAAASPTSLIQQIAEYVFKNAVTDMLCGIFFAVSHLALAANDLMQTRNQVG